MGIAVQIGTVEIARGSRQFASKGCRGTRRTPVVAVIPQKILACTFIAFDWFASSSGWNSIIHCHRDVWMALMLLLVLRAESLNLLPYKWQRERARRTRRNAPAFTQISIFPLFIFAAVATMAGFADANHGKLNSDCSRCPGCTTQPHCAAGLICTKNPAHGSDRSYCKTAPTVATPTATSTTIVAATTTATTTTTVASTTTTTTTATTTTVSPCQGWAAVSVGVGGNTGDTNVLGDDSGDDSGDASYEMIGDGWCSHDTPESAGNGSKGIPYRIQAWTSAWSYGLRSCKSYCSKDTYCIGLTHFSDDNDCYIHSCSPPKADAKEVVSIDLMPWSLVSEEENGEKEKEYPAEVKAITTSSKAVFINLDIKKPGGMKCYRRILLPATTTVLSGSAIVETWTFQFDSFDGGGSNTSMTSIGANNGQLTATVHQGASLGPGRLEEGGDRGDRTKALSFDGVGTSGSDGQHVSIDGGITMGGGPITVCAWAKLRAFGNWSRIVDIGNGESSDNIVLNNWKTSNSLMWEIRLGSTLNYVSIANILELDKWMHICGTVEATGEMKVYINGAEQACTGMAHWYGGYGNACVAGKGINGYTPDRLLRKNAYIGRSNYDTDAYFNGSISDVTIVDGKALAASEIMEMMLGNSASTSTPAPTSTSTTLGKWGDSIIPTNFNDGFVSCDAYCNLAINGEAKLGSACVAAARGAVGHANGWDMCSDRSTLYAAPGCVLCTEEAETTGAAGLTCWCDISQAKGELTTTHAPLPGRGEGGNVGGNVGGQQPSKPAPVRITLTPAWHEADYFGVSAGWDPKSTYYARECLGICAGTQPPCRVQPYVMAGAPKNFQDFLQCEWTNGDVTTASDAAAYLSGSLSVKFDLSWDSVAGHGKTGPGGFNLDAGDGSVPAAVPQQAGYFHAVVTAVVTVLQADNSSVAIKEMLPIKRFGFKVDGDPPFQISKYARSTDLCLQVSNTAARIVSENAAVAAATDGDDAAVDVAISRPYRCDDELSVLRTYVGATYRIAPIQILTSKNQVGDVIAFALEGAPAGFLIDAYTGEIQAAPRIGTDRVDPYTVDVVAFDEAGSKAWLESIAISISAKPVVRAAAAVGRKDSGPVVGGVLGSIIVLMLAVLVAVQYNAYRLKMAVHDFKRTIDAMLAEGQLDAKQVATQALPHEINRRCITLISELGTGAFGAVWKGRYKEGGLTSTDVAVKTVLDGSKTSNGAKELLQEAVVMAQVGVHPNVVQMLGVVTSGEPMMLVLTLCKRGSLLELLREAVLKDEPIEISVKMKMCQDVALGMAHLHSNLFLHRDLAARNILLDHAGVSKVADFGLSRATQVSEDDGGDSDDDDEKQYYTSKNGMFPIRWTSPESIETFRFTPASDIWSFGVVMYECFRNGAQPYKGMKNAQVMQSVPNGYRLERPADVSVAQYQIVLQCWAESPSQRPGFASLALALAPHTIHVERSIIHGGGGGGETMYDHASSNGQPDLDVRHRASDAVVAMVAMDAVGFENDAFKDAAATPSNVAETSFGDNGGNDDSANYMDVASTAQHSTMSHTNTMMTGTKNRAGAAIYMFRPTPPVSAAATARAAGVAAPPALAVRAAPSPRPTPTPRKAKPSNPHNPFVTLIEQQNARKTKNKDFKGININMDAGTMSI